jgi:hypothetical protein
MRRHWPSPAAKVVGRPRSGARKQTIIESVYTTNPVTKIRHLDLERITEGAKYPRVYVSVFRNRQALREHLLDISWETEVWLVDEPDHLLHFDGDKYIVPHTQPAGPPAEEQRDG